MSVNFQTQVLSGLRHSSHWLTSNPATQNAVTSEGALRRHRYPLADLQLLELGNVRTCARVAEVVEVVVAEEVRSVAADLDGPRPDQRGRCLDSDGTGATGLRFRRELVAGRAASTSPMVAIARTWRGVAVGWTGVSGEVSWSAWGALSVNGRRC